MILEIRLRYWFLWPALWFCKLAMKHNVDMRRRLVWYVFLLLYRTSCFWANPHPRTPIASGFSGRLVPSYPKLQSSYVTKCNFPQRLRYLTNLLWEDIYQKLCLTYLSLWGRRNSWADIWHKMGLGYTSVSIALVTYQTFQMQTSIYSLYSTGA